MADAPKIFKLPNEVLCKVFEYLDFYEYYTHTTPAYSHTIPTRLPHTPTRFPHDSRTIPTRLPHTPTRFPHDSLILPHDSHTTPSYSHTTPTRLPHDSHTLEFIQMFDSIQFNSIQFKSIQIKHRCLNELYRVGAEPNFENSMKKLKLAIPTPQQ